MDINVDSGVTGCCFTRIRYHYEVHSMKTPLPQATTQCKGLAVGKNMRRGLGQGSWQTSVRDTGSSTAKLVTIMKPVADPEPIL